MRITAVQAEPILGTIRPDIAIVSSLGEHLVGQYVLARVETDDGLVGVGEASVTAVWSGETQTGTIAVIQELLRPVLIGADPFDIEWLVRRMEHAVHGNSFAKAAVEMALLDVQGQALQVPIYKLLGGRDRDEQVGLAVPPAGALFRLALRRRTQHGTNGKLLGNLRHPGGRRVPQQLLQCRLLRERQVELGEHVRQKRKEFFKQLFLGRRHVVRRGHLDGNDGHAPVTRPVRLAAQYLDRPGHCHHQSGARSWAVHVGRDPD